MLQAIPLSRSRALMEADLDTLGSTRPPVEHVECAHCKVDIFHGILNGIDGHSGSRISHCYSWFWIVYSIKPYPPASSFISTPHLRILNLIHHHPPFQNYAPPPPSSSQIPALSRRYTPFPPELRQLSYRGSPTPSTPSTPKISP